MMRVGVYRIRLTAKVRSYFGVHGKGTIFFRSQNRGRLTAKGYNLYFRADIPKGTIIRLLLVQKQSCPPMEPFINCVTHDWGPGSKKGHVTRDGIDKRPLSRPSKKRDHCRAACRITLFCRQTAVQYSIV